VTPRRIEWVDAARGLGIFCVVLGHVLDGLIVSRLANENGFAADVIAFIYQFHMPLFFVLAGWFAARGVKRPVRTIATEKASALLYPYVIWGTLQTTVQIAAAGSTNTPADKRDLLRLFYDPPMQFWFLYCLILCHTIHVAADRFGLGATGLAGLALAWYFAGHELEIRATSVGGRLRDNLPHFAAGVLLASTLPRMAGLPKSALLAIAGSGFAANGMLAGTGISWLPAAWPGVLATLSAGVLLEKVPGLAELGRLSMEIYVAHVLAYAAVRVALLRGLGISSLPVHLLLGCLAGLLLPVLLAVAARRLGIRGLFRFPAARPSTRPGSMANMDAPQSNA
jgi:uncharacterized membrane protein YcfT